MARKKKSYTGVKIILIAVIIAIIAATGLIIKLCLDLVSSDSGNTKPSTSQTSQKPKKEKPTKPTETEPEPTEEALRLVASASISAQGDLLMHKKLITANKTEDGYDFDSVFRYMKEYTAKADYSIANLETTLGGSNFPYQGSPAFNCPDAIADAAKNAGYDMLLTANNHCNDTLKAGIDRTLEQVRDRGLETLGTRLSDDESRYSVVDINGIRIGMTCYTYVMGVDGRGVCLNGENTYLQQNYQVNYFTDRDLETFYAEIQQVFNAMISDGAEATMLFIHWGNEYETTENATQRSIAQKMCDMGFDVIVGGHPHVVQPMALLTSNENPDHRTVCIYSLGNAISNQLVEEMSQQKSGHTEDGVLLTVNFEKYSDGQVFLTDVDAIPTWGHRDINDNALDYYIIPVTDKASNIAATASGGSVDSYNRTMAIIGSGLQTVQNYLQQARSEREASMSN